MAAEDPGGPDLDLHGNGPPTGLTVAEAARVGPTACLWVQQPAKTCVPAERASFSVLALFKNEGDILWEWSCHYLDQGARWG